jgi:hypothetical protein
MFFTLPGLEKAVMQLLKNSIDALKMHRVAGMQLRMRLRRRLDTPKFQEAHLTGEVNVRPTTDFEINFGRLPRLLRQKLQAKTDFEEPPQ